MVPDEERIYAVWRQLDEAWNARDAEAFGALFTGDALFAFMDTGDRMEGQSAIHDRFSRQFPAMPSDLRHETRLRTVRNVAPGVCTADGVVDVIRGSATDASAAVIFRSFWLATVMLETADGWKIRELHVHRRQ